MQIHISCILGQCANHLTTWVPWCHQLSICVVPYLRCQCRLRQYCSRYFYCGWFGRNNPAPYSLSCHAYTLLECISLAAWLATAFSCLRDSRPQTSNPPSLCTALGNSPTFCTVILVLSTFKVQRLLVCLLELYILATSKVIAEWMQTCKSVHSCHPFSVAPLAANTMNQYPTQLHYPDKVQTSAFIAKCQVRKC